MKKISVTLRRERIVFNGLLLLEQILGNRLFTPFNMLKKKSMRWQLKRLEAQTPAKKMMVERVSNLSAEEFHSNYFRASRPVIFAGQATEWPCVKNWDLDTFSLGHGDKDVLLVNAQGLTSRQDNSHFEFLTLRELINNIKAGGTKYLRFSPFLENNPELVQDLNLSWLEKMKGPKTFASTYYMFLGGKNNKTLLHTDQPCNLYVQVYGEKKWTLFSAKDSSLLYPQISNTAYIKSPVDVDSPDLQKYPLFQYATAYEAVLKPGDILYVPPHTWHFVENLEDTIAVGYRFSSLKAALKSSFTLSLLRVLSTNPPLWKTMAYGKVDTNLIWAHAGGRIKELLKAKSMRKDAKS